MNENRTLTAATKIRSDVYSFGSSNAALLLADGFSGFIKRRWRLVAKSALIVVVLGVIAYNFLPSYYRATAVVALKLPAQRDGQTTLQSAEQRTQLELQALQSRELAAQVIAELELASRPEFNSELRRGSFLSHVSTLISEFGRLFRSSPVPSRAERDALRASAIVDEFTARLSVSPLRMTGLIQVSFASEDARTAYMAANAVANTYIKSATAARAAELQKTAAAVEERIGSILEELREAPARAGGLAAMERQLEARKTLLQSYIAKLGEIMLERSTLETHAVLQAPAVLPLRPAGLPLSRILPVLAVSGILFGAALALWRELTAKTILAPSQLQSLFGVRVIAVSEAASKGAEDIDEISGQLGLEILLSRQGARNSIVALISMGAESTAPEIVRQTARTIAKAGRRVLLIQTGDIQRQAKQGNSVAIENFRQTTSARNDPPPVRRDDDSPMDILTTELNTRSAAAACEKTGKIVLAMGEAYEFVVLHVEFNANGAEFRYVAGLADAAALIVSDQQCRRDDLRSVLGDLALLGVNTIGSVILRARPGSRPAPARTRARKLKVPGLRRMSRVWHNRLGPLVARMGSRSAQNHGGPHQPSRARWRRLLFC